MNEVHQSSLRQSVTSIFLSAEKSLQAQQTEQNTNQAEADFDAKTQTDTQRRANSKKKRKSSLATKGDYNVPSSSKLKRKETSKKKNKSQKKFSPAQPGFIASSGEESDKVSEVQVELGKVTSHEYSLQGEESQNNSNKQHIDLNQSKFSAIDRISEEANMTPNQYNNDDTEEGELELDYLQAANVKDDQLDQKSKKRLTSSSRPDLQPVQVDITQLNLAPIQSVRSVEIQSKENVQKEEQSTTQIIEKPIPNNLKIRIDLTGTKYKVLKECAQLMGWKVILAKKSNQPLIEKPGENDSKKLKSEYQAQQELAKKEEANRHANVDIIWHDVTIPPEKLAQIKGFQRVNHFPSMSGVTKKNQLAASLKKMKNQYPIDFGFFPKTWIIPNQLAKLKADLQKERAANMPPILIVKPSESCQGRGIFFINDVDKLKEILNQGDKLKTLNTQGYVVQRYIQNPYLLDGLKFDLRLYVVVTSCSPLTIFWHKAGLARFATQPYSVPLKVNNNLSQNVHLTNYAINKDSEHFKISDEDIKAGTSSKRSLDTVYARLEKDGVDIALLKLKIADLIIKTLISIQPDLLHSYRMCQPNDRTFNMCFEILGFDVLIDQNTKPWLLEVNQAPSFQTDSELDLSIKRQVIADTFKLLGVTDQNRQRNINRMLRDRELKKMHKQSTLFWNQM